MVAPRFRSHTYRRVAKKLPSGTVKTQFVKPKAQLPKCAVCKAELKGVKTDGKGVSARRVARPFGGNLCAACSRRQIKAGLRKQQ